MGKETEGIKVVTKMLYNLEIQLLTLKSFSVKDKSFFVQKKERQTRVILTRVFFMVKLW